MKIVADQNIAEVDAFRQFGDLFLYPGREINNSVVKDADVLLVRSVTPVNKVLLADTSVSFVGSATSGIDHVDQHWLASNKIHFVYTPGCNARSVVEYVIASLAYLHLHTGNNWLQKSIGIIGAGHVGGLLADTLLNIGVRYSIYDPFLDASFRHKSNLVDFTEVLNCDVLTLHTPLSSTGKFPTRHIFNQALLSKLAAGKILINAARGGVLDNQALLQRLEYSNDIQCVLDTWENEPCIDQQLLKQASIATPHIAGYSRPGKLNGSLRLLESLASRYGQAVKLPDTEQQLRLLKPDGLSQSNADKLISSYILAAYDIGDDHRKLVESQNAADSESRARAFDLLRRDYPQRAEFGSYAFAGTDVDRRVKEILGTLGFVMQ